MRISTTFFSYFKYFPYGAKLKDEHSFKSVLSTFSAFRTLCLIVPIIDDSRKKTRSSHFPFVLVLFPLSPVILGDMHTRTHLRSASTHLAPNMPSSPRNRTRLKKLVKRELDWLCIRSIALLNEHAHKQVSK